MVNTVDICHSNPTARCLVAVIVLMTSAATCLVRTVPVPESCQHDRRLMTPRMGMPRYLLDRHRQPTVKARCFHLRQGLVRPVL